MIEKETTWDSGEIPSSSIMRTKNKVTYLTFVATCDPCGCALWWSCVSYRYEEIVYSLFASHLNKLLTRAFSPPRRCWCFSRTNLFLDKPRVLPLDHASTKTFSSVHLTAAPQRTAEVTKSRVIIRYLTWNTNYSLSLSLNLMKNDEHNKCEIIEWIVLYISSPRLFVVGLHAWVSCDGHSINQLWARSGVQWWWIMPNIEEWEKTQQEKSKWKIHKFKFHHENLFSIPINNSKSIQFSAQLQMNFSPSLCCCF